MSVHVALLRGINVGGHALVAMADLRALLAELGFGDARTLLQSGNAVFSGRARSGAALETRLEDEAAKRFGGVRPAFFLRSVDEWADMIARNPFPVEARRDPARLVAMFLKAAPVASAVEALRASVAGREVIRVGTRHLYITYPDGQGRSKLTGALIEKKLGIAGTARNWNTVLKLAELAQSLERGA